MEVLSTTPYAGLPSAAITRMGISPDQKNLLVRLVIRHPVKTLTSNEANAVRDRVYQAVHRGHVGEWESQS